MKDLAVLTKIQRRQVADLLLFGFVQGMLRGNPAITPALAFRDFIMTFAPDANEESVKSTYYRMLREFIQDHQSVKTQNSSVYDHQQEV